MELIFFRVADMRPYFGLVLGRVLIIQGCFRYCLIGLAQQQVLFSSSGWGCVEMWEETPRLLYVVLSSNISGRCNGLEEGNKGGQRAGRNVLWGVAEEFGFTQFGEKEIERWPYCSLHLTENGMWRWMC